jgi:predicted permease
MLGECAIPLGLVIVGAILFDLLSKPGWHADAGAAVGGGLMRLGVLPLLMLGALFLIPSASSDFRHVVAVQAAMPAAVFPMIIARRYGGHEATAMRVIVMTTLVSLLTIPFAVKLALQWVS